MLIFTVILLSISIISSTAAMIRSRVSFQPLRLNHFVHKCFRGILPSMALSTSAESSDTDVVNGVAKVAASKRKVALTLAYVGSNYHGLQMDLKSGVPTIEAELEEALFKMGCITEANHLDLAKISWSRSSRTDKHVHCARLVISAKLEIPVDWIPENAQRIFPMVEKLNALLPPDIRCLSACKINQSFRAREACSWREYEYVLPKALLLDSTILSKSLDEQKAEEERAIEVFACALNKLEGNLGFHNFHRVSPKNLRRRVFSDDEDDFNDRNKVQDVVPAGQQVPGEEGEEGEEAEAVENSSNSSAAIVQEETKLEVVAENVSPESSVVKSPGNRITPGPPQTWNYFDNWEPVLRARNEMTRGVVFACEIIGDSEGPGTGVLGPDFIRIRIRGQSFMLHQIRLMIAAAALSAREIVPDMMIDLALIGPHFINLPLAPAEGLIVVNSGYEGNSNGQSVHLFNPKYTESTGKEPFSLMTEAEFKFSEEFKRDHIYAKIAEDWNKNNSYLITSWLENAERYRPCEATLSAWKDAMTSAIEVDAQEREIRKVREMSRLESNVLRFEKDFLGPADADKEKGKPKKFVKTGKSPKGKKVWVEDQKITVGHSKLLPNGLSTALIKRFRILPGDDVSKIQKSLATMFVLRQLDTSMTADELVEYVEKNGGLSYFLNDAFKHNHID